jgi:hypothetical protein
MELAKTIESFLSSLFVAALIALIVWIASWIRNVRLEKGLKRGISPNGIGVGYNTGTKEGFFDIQINNLSNVTIRVRKVVLVAAEEQGHVELEYAKEKGIYQTPLLNQILQPGFKRTHLAKGFTDTAETRDYVKLPPNTMAIWQIGPKRLRDKKWFARDIIVAVEYPTIFGNTALIKFKVSDDFLKRARACLNDVIKSVHNDTPLELPVSLSRIINKAKHNK